VADREDYVNFDAALRELKLTEDQLKRLVSEGEIRAIRGDNNSMKFRRDEIERLKQDTGKTIQYTEESSDTLTDDLLFDESNDLDVSEEGMATAQISSEDTFVGDDTRATAPPIKPGKHVKKVTVTRTETGPSARLTPAPRATPGRTSTQAVRRTTGRSTRIRQTSALQQASGIGMGVTAMLVVSFIVFFYAALVWLDIANDHISGATRGFANWAHTSFVKD
jgi:hypothetical protein